MSGRGRTSSAMYPARRQERRRGEAGRLLALALVAGSVLAGCGGGGGEVPSPYQIARHSTLHQILERKKLIVGMEVEFWPFEYDDGHGNPTGFDVDLARELARELGVELELRDLEWTGLIPSLLEGKIDLIISGMTATLERARTIAFSEPYYHTALCLLVQRQSPIQSAAELDRPEVTLALKTGTTGHFLAEREFPRARKRFFKDEAACALEVAQGRAQAFVYDLVSIVRHAREYPESTRAILEPLGFEPYAIAFRQGEPDLGRYLDTFVRRLRADGRLKALERKYLGEIAAGLEPPGH
ncbi:MAG: hypothetical protein KatS3mg102_2926 [Planctomycetota bacterium]|nr:MAG: hypothetical protein KatS3mg102_2926 [Planctomycetota bacterium]